MVFEVVQIYSDSMYYLTEQMGTFWIVIRISVMLLVDHKYIYDPHTC